MCLSSIHLEIFIAENAGKTHHNQMPPWTIPRINKQKKKKRGEKEMKVKRKREKKEKCTLSIPFPVFHSFE